MITWYSFKDRIIGLIDGREIYKIVPINSSKEWKVRSITALNGIQHKMPQKLIEFCNRELADLDGCFEEYLGAVYTSQDLIGSVKI